MKKNFSDPTVKFFISVLGLFIIFFVLKELQHIFIPFTIAYFLFFIFEPFNQFLIRKKIPLFVSIVLDLLIIIGIVWGISGMLIGSFGNFSEELPAFEIKLNHLVSNIALSIGVRDAHFTNFNLSAFMQTFNYGGLASGLFNSTMNIFSALFLILFFFIFITSGHDKIFEAIRKRYVEKNIKSVIKKMKRGNEIAGKDSSINIFPESDDIYEIRLQREIKLKQTFKEITSQIQQYIVTKFFISLSTGVIIGFILFLFGVKYFIIWAAVAFLLNFIPNIGSVIAVILPALMSLLQFESFGLTIIIVLLLSLVQNVIGNILEPKIFGDRLGLNPLVILLSLLLWGYIWGIVGMIISVPLTAILKLIISGSSSKNLKFISDLMSN